MELYILDSLLRRSAVIDSFQSLIWTERYSAVGDFELVIYSTVESRSLLTATTRLAINESYRVMTIETVESKLDSEGRYLLTVKGRSLEEVLDDRVAKSSLSNLTDDPKWVLTGTPGDIARIIFQDVCVDGKLNVGDKIPFIMSSGSYQHRTNICVNPNFELDLSGWTAEASAVFTRDLVTPITGVASPKVVGGDVYSSGSIVAGESVTFSLDYTTVGTVTGTPKISITLPDASIVSVNLPLTQAVKARFSVTATAATSGIFKASIFGATTPGIIHFDNVLIEKVAVAGTYFDGSTPDIAGVMYYTWMNLPNASASIAITPFTEGASIFPIGTILESSEVISVALDPDTVYKDVKELCDIYGLGFRLVRNFDTSQLYFDVYSGSDRTTGQIIFPAVVFSPDLDTLSDVSELTSVASYKNVAYVFSSVGTEVVYATDIDPTTAGFERHVMVVMANDITSPVNASAALILEGKKALAGSRSMSALDGEVSQNGSYQYAIDYNLGDLVEMRNSDGVTNSMRVTEQIFVSDSNGERSYPTLVMETFITPGTWLAWGYDEIWDDAIGYWQDA